jgi:hypothetical protein
MAGSYDIAVVDEIRRRLDCSYEEAVLGLEAADGDLVHALAATERIKGQRDGAQISGELIGQAIELSREGKLKGLRVKLGDRAVGEVPLPKGTAGGALGALLTLLLSRVSVEMVSEESEAPEAEACTSKTPSSP